MCVEFTTATGSMALGIGIASLVLLSIGSIAYDLLSWLNAEDEAAPLVPGGSPAT